VLFAKAARRVRQPRPVQFLWKPFRVDRNSPLSCCDPWHAANLVGTGQPGEKEDGSKIGRAWPLP
jgi:hypothetical protein